jgi:hypothetical protein
MESPRRFACNRQMPVVNGIECAAKQSNSQLVATRWELLQYVDADVPGGAGLAAAHYPPGKRFTAELNTAVGIALFHIHAQRSKSIPGESHRANER